MLRHSGSPKRALNSMSITPRSAVIMYPPYKIPLYSSPSSALSARTHAALMARASSSTDWVMKGRRWSAHE